MGRRKIEIKAIKDDRNRSVTFLKRKFGLFKKAHELSVLCSADVAVFIFGANKKLYEYSSADMRDLITRYQYHGVPNEHKGPSDFNGGNDEDDEDEGDGTPPRPADGMDPHMMPFQPSFAHIRHHTPSASPPIPNGVPFQPHPGHHVQRAHTPQPGGIGSRPGSRNDMRRLGPNMVSQPVGPPQGPHPGITYMPTPPIYNPPTSQPPSSMMPQSNVHYPFPPPPQPQHPQQHQPQHPQQQHQQHPPQHQPQHQPQHPQHQPQHPPQHQPQHQPQPQPYMEDRRSAPPPPPPVYGAQPPAQPIPITRTEPSPPPPSHQQIPQYTVTTISPPPQPERRLQDPLPPPPVEPKNESDRPPQSLLLNTNMAIKKFPHKKGHSIFTPIEENVSPLSQHLASFAPSAHRRGEAAANITTAPATNRAPSAEAASNRNGVTSSPPLAQTSGNQPFPKPRTVSESSASETTFTPPSRSNSLKGSARPRGPRLTVQIPDGGSETGSVAGDSNTSPRPQAEPAAAQAPRRNSNIVLPPPSPSASALLSAGATGPPNPFARPVPMNVDTPASALPSRFLNADFLPSPSSFYQDWNFRGNDSNTLPSPLNFATPLVGSGPSFLREEITHTTSNGNTTSTGATTSTSNNAAGSSDSNGQGAGAGKRKSPEFGAHGEDEGHEVNGDAKRVKVE